MIAATTRTLFGDALVRDVRGDLTLEWSEGGARPRPLLHARRAARRRAVVLEDGRGYDDAELFAGVAPVEAYRREELAATLLPLFGRQGDHVPRELGRPAARPTQGHVSDAERRLVAAERAGDVLEVARQHARLRLLRRERGGRRANPEGDDVRLAVLATLDRLVASGELNEAESARLRELVDVDAEEAKVRRQVRQAREGAAAPVSPVIAAACGVQRWTDDNNETDSIGVFSMPDGRFLAKTLTQSKWFKTLTGAKKWLDRKQGEAQQLPPRDPSPGTNLALQFGWFVAWSQNGDAPPTFHAHFGDGQPPVVSWFSVDGRTTVVTRYDRSRASWYVEGDKLRKSSKPRPLSQDDAGDVLNRMLGQGARWWDGSARAEQSAEQLEAMRERRIRWAQAPGSRAVVQRVDGPDDMPPSAFGDDLRPLRGSHHVRAVWGDGRTSRTIEQLLPGRTLPRHAWLTDALVQRLYDASEHSQSTWGPTEGVLELLSVYTSSASAYEVLSKGGTLPVRVSLPGVRDVVAIATWPSPLVPHDMPRKRPQDWQERSREVVVFDLATNDRTPNGAQGDVDDVYFDVLLSPDPDVDPADTDMPWVRYYWPNRARSSERLERLDAAGIAELRVVARRLPPGRGAVLDDAFEPHPWDDAVPLDSVGRLRAWLAERHR